MQRRPDRGCVAFLCRARVGVAHVLALRSTFTKGNVQRIGNDEPYLRRQREMEAAVRQRGQHRWHLNDRSHEAGIDGKRVGVVVVAGI